MRVHASGADAAYESLAVRRDDGLAEIQLCRPNLLNRFDDVLHRELTAAIAQVASDSAIRVAVLSSTGQYFSAGGDMEMMLEANKDTQRRIAMFDRGRMLFRALADFPKPLVVALAGEAHGLGAT